MRKPILEIRPGGTALRQRAGRTMDVTLHLGVHRTASTTFQSYMRRNHGQLSGAKIRFWGPWRTRKGLFAGILPGPDLTSHMELQQRAEARVRFQMDATMRNGAQHLMVSDENMIGSVRDNLRNHCLYPGIGNRMSRYARVFDGNISRLVISIRAQDQYWESAVNYGVARGHSMPRPRVFRKIASSNRTWRDVITDLACAVPDVEILVAPFERFAGRPEAFLTASIGCDAPVDRRKEWLNRTPTAQGLQRILRERGDTDQLVRSETQRWQPFDTAQRAAMREAYADDMHWLVAGADGLAKLTEDQDQNRAGKILPAGPNTRGQFYDTQERQVARSGRR